MTHPQWQVNSEHQCALSGPLDRDTVPALWTELQAFKPTQNEMELSLKAVERIDSAGMVMLIHLLENAKKQNCHIMLSFVPTELRTLFQLSNVEQVVAGHLKNTTGVNCG
ncbi:lipid asymmetry maintenance protein MlaB [Vibrio brasiliensis]|jgi:phospholipid transport system transporter-binding protein|uniref:STAS domain-containing protein n=1 Tax=Vibrio brasiliensis TaxID=170652 RepID=UPI001EFE9AE0|nr:lipid asymmetry maintenance protein MlaB [Vibrio brasiliensis]MCG9651254.1 lipid asymmetry maintenance protein MlaB [Vibrio brasiliensis]MCG9727132.1 lipid asymmetry maintenance protein MlaB [Vibrio brasiliensis]MCG9785218.1 lipid asymmetry maintenance protein MlaB [Vibrio brasiliensis]